MSPVDWSKTCIACQYCCTYVSLEIDAPKTETDYDVIRWYLAHRNINIYIDDDDLYGPQKYQMLESTLWFGLVTILSIGASAVLYTIVEHPIEQRLRQLQRTWIARRQPAAVVAATPTPAPAKTSTTDA